jgi:hypothetical protein
MSLIVDCSNCVAGKAPQNDEERAWLERLGFGSVIVKLDAITVDNLPEWLFRFRFVERLLPDPSEEPISVAAIERWVGLRTNVGPVTRSEWVPWLAVRAAEDVLTSLPGGLMVA